MSGRKSKEEQLRDAATNGDTKKAKSLIDKGADIDAADEDGKTALMWAKKEGHKEIVKYLKEYAAGLGSKDSSGKKKVEKAEEAPGLLTCPVTGMELVLVKGGCYQMGDTFGDDFPEEKPVHEVCVSDFYIGKYEVTQGQWKKVMGKNPSKFKTCGENCPVETVSWDDIQNFLSKLNSQSGKNYRLPTEAEWEYAARSGGKKEKYSGTSSKSSLDDYAWYGHQGRTHPVGQKKPNGVGIYDMSGNVWEWCSDWYGEDYYGESPRDNPQGSSSGSCRVIRGGGWDSESAFMRASIRSDTATGKRSDNVGFRLVAPRGQ